MCAHTLKHFHALLRLSPAGVCTVSLKWFRFRNQTTNDHGGSTRLSVISASASAPANVSASVSSSKSSTGGTNVCQACQKFALFVAHNFLINFLPDADAAHSRHDLRMRACVCVCVATAASAPASTSLSATARHTLSLPSHRCRCPLSSLTSYPSTKCDAAIHSGSVRLKHKSKVVIDKHTHTQRWRGCNRSLSASASASAIIAHWTAFVGFDNSSSVSPVAAMVVTNYHSLLGRSKPRTQNTYTTDSFGRQRHRSLSQQADISVIMIIIS